jgi:glycosyltransferase involved in cell wall biosynthesis
MHRYKLAILVSHPIQYQAPLFKKLAKETDLTVYFCWDFGVGKESYDIEFGKKLSWDIPLLEGYNYKFLKNYSLKPSSEFWGQINFGIIKELISRTSDVPEVQPPQISNCRRQSREAGLEVEPRKIERGLSMWRGWTSNTNNNQYLGSPTSRTSDVQNSKYDAILVFGWNSFTNWLVFLTAFLHKTPIFLRGENPLNQELLKPEWKIEIKKIILGWLFKRISAFLYIGEENKKFYEFYGAPEPKLFFCPYAVENERFIKQVKSEKRKANRKKLGIKEKDVVILFVGKLIEKKRPMDLLKAYELLTKSYKLKTKSLSLVFVGDGALRRELEDYAKEHNLQNVYFVGFKNQTELPQYYVISDVFVLPSGIGETWGLAVNEAMCFSLPVIVSDIVGCGPDLVKHGENGYIFPLGNIEKLAEYLGELVKKPARIKTFGKKSFKIIQEYSYEKDIEGILTALKSMVLR